MLKYLKNEFDFSVFLMESCMFAFKSSLRPFDVQRYIPTGPLVQEVEQDLSPTGGKMFMKTSKDLCYNS